MENERSGAEAASKSGDKPAAHRSRHRSGRSGRSGGPSAAAPAAKTALATKTASAAKTALAGKAFPASKGASATKGTPATKGASAKGATRWTWREYLLQLSVVIIGIMVTFIGSGLVSDWSRQRQVKRAMQLIVAELKANREHLDSCCDELILDRQGMLMFERYGKNVDLIPEDSLACYMPLLGSSQEFKLQSDALEFLKLSGAIQSVNDDALLMQILGCYRALEVFSRAVDSYSRRKEDAMDHFLANASPEFLARFNVLECRDAWRAMLADPLCVSFVGMTKNYFAYGDDNFLTSDIGDCRKTIAAIDEKYGFR